MSVIIKGDSAFDISIVSKIKDVKSQYIKFQNIYFKCKSIEDAGGTIFVKRKKGKWNKYYHGINEIPSFTYSCNQCGYSAPYGLYGGKYSQKEWNFCPSCGADMRGEQE